MKSSISFVFSSCALLVAAATAACGGAPSDSTSGSTSDLSADSTPVTADACTAATRLPGSYTLTYNAGQPLPPGIETVGKIVIEKGADSNPDNIPYPNIAIQTKFPVDKQYSPSGFLWADIGSFNLGPNVDTGAAIGTGKLAADERSFSWSTTEDIQGLADEGLAGGQFIKASISLGSGCVATYVLTTVKGGLTPGHKVTSADYEDTTYKLQRN